MLEAAVHDAKLAEPVQDGTVESDRSEPEDACSEDDASSEGDEPDAHAFGNESLLDAGTDSADVRDAVINVAPAEGQHPVSVYLDKCAEESDILGGRARPVNQYSYKQLCRVELRHYRRLAAQRPGTSFSSFVNFKFWI